MNATGRDDFGNLRLSIFKEDVLHANVTNWCCDGNAVGLAVVLIAFSFRSINLSNQPVAVAFR